MKIGKRFKKAKELVDSQKKYTVTEAFDVVVKTAQAKFDETIDVAIRLGVDPKQGDQQVRGAIALPNGLGKNVRILVFAKGPKEAEAKNAGADYVGSDELVAKINSGWLDFDKAIATPDMMSTVSKVAKVLGPRGLMPNPKVGTVTLNIGEAVATEKKGKLDFRVDKAGIVHVGIGKKSMGSSKLKENFEALLGQVMKLKPSSSKGIYLKGVTVSSTMGPGLKVDTVEIVNKMS